MQNAVSWLLFAVFAIVQMAMYLGIRRRWLSPMLIAAIGVLISIILMTLVSVAEGYNAYQALFVGFLGGLFSVVVLMMAMYFARSEARRQG